MNTARNKLNLKLIEKEVGETSRISFFYDITISMQWRKDWPKHIHAQYQNHSGYYSISENSILIYGDGLPKTGDYFVKTWISIYLEELLENWERAQRGDYLIPIKALR